MVRAIVVGAAVIGWLAACGTGSIGTEGQNPTVNPDPGPGPGPAPTPQPEECNGFDDDLDGEIDEGCACSIGTTQQCYPGQASQLQGQCKAGTMTCEGTGEFGTWGPCTGAVGPVAETSEMCGDGIDQDCDGADLPCGNTTDPDPPPVSGACEEFTVGVNSRPVDIVIAIDQSGSMGDDINNVRAQINVFANTMATAKADYRVILVAARFNDPDNHEVCVPQPLAGPGCSDSARFKQIDQHVDSHDAFQRLMQHAGGFEAFMRPNSLRQFVVITDDESNTPWAVFQGFLALRPGYSDYVFHSIVGYKDGGCSKDKGKDYLALTTMTGGLQFDICQASWSSLFVQLAQAASTVTGQFTLGKKPKQGTIKVDINGQPAQPGVQWDYDATINQIVLKGQLPPDGTKIKVCYELP